MERPKMQRLPQRHIHVIAVIAIACWRLAGTTAVHAQTISCLNCHTNEMRLFSTSAHAQAGLNCVDCHGGDPKISDETAHATDNFRSPDTKQGIADLCASCHSDVRRMNPYGLATDQLARYKTSKHGEQLFAHNDQKVAVCTDCHGVHDILSPKTPASRVYPTNIPQTCGGCHANAQLMDQHKLPSNIVALYKTSYHATMLFEKGDLSAPTCVTCHGSHGASPPGTAQVGEVCGKCHVRQRELFDKSPHAELAAAGLFNECVSCHGNHGIQKASVELFATSCSQCHAKDPKQLQLRDQLAGLIHRAQADYTNAVTAVHDATVRGLATDDEQLLLQEAKTQVTQMEAMQHLLAVDPLQPIATRFDGIVKQTLGDVADLARLERWKRNALGPIWAFLVLMAMLFWAKRRQLEHKRKP